MFTGGWPAWAAGQCRVRREPKSLSVGDGKIKTAPPANAGFPARFWL